MEDFKEEDVMVYEVIQKLINVFKNKKVKTIIDEFNVDDNRLTGSRNLLDFFYSLLLNFNNLILSNVIESSNVKGTKKGKTFFEGYKEGLLDGFRKHFDALISEKFPD